LYNWQDCLLRCIQDTTMIFSYILKLYVPVLIYFQSFNNISQTRTCPPGDLKQPSCQYEIDFTLAISSGFRAPWMSCLFANTNNDDPASLCNKIFKDHFTRSTPE
jgi:hypothetical protein